MQSRKQLLDRIQGLADPNSPLPIVTLEQFFVGNDYLESIVGEGNTQVQPQVLYSLFKRLLEIDGIHKICVEVKEIGHPDKWPIADTFWFVADADPRRYRAQWPDEFWDHSLPSDYLSFPRKDARVTEPIEIPDGMVAIGMQYYNAANSPKEDD